MNLDRAINHRQTDAGAPLLGSVIQLENLRQVLGGNAHSCIFDAHADALVWLRGAVDAEPPTLRHGLDGVLRQVEEHVSQLRGIARDQQTAVGAAAGNRDARAVRLGLHRIEHARHERRNRHGAELRFVGAHEFQEALDALVKAANLLLDDLDVLRGRLPRRQLLLQQLEMNRHRIERVLHLVRDAGGEPADHRDAARQLGELRRLDALRRRRAQLRADLVEHVTQLAELRVVPEIEPGAQVAAAEARQAAADYVHRLQHDLGEQHGGNHRDEQRDTRGQRRRRQRFVQVLLDQERRHADADLAERLIAERDRLAPLERLLG